MKKSKNGDDAMHGKASAAATWVMAVATLLLVLATSFLAFYTMDMAVQTKNMVRETTRVADIYKGILDLEANPSLVVYCYAKYDFETSNKDGIEFKASDYMANKNIKFFVDVKNEWTSDIKDADLTLHFEVALLNENGDVENERNKIQKGKYEKIKVSLVRSGYLGEEELEKLNSTLEEGDYFDGIHLDDSYTIRVRITSDSELSGYKWAGLKIEYQAPTEK